MNTHTLLKDMKLINIINFGRFCEYICIISIRCNLEHDEQGFCLGQWHPYYPQIDKFDGQDILNHSTTEQVNFSDNSVTT